MPRHRTKLKPEREIDTCLQCQVRFVWNQSKEGLCFWCEKSNSKPNRRRRKSLER